MPISPSHPSNGCNVTKQEAEHRGQGILHRRDRNLLGHDVPGSLVDPAERSRCAGRITGLINVCYDTQRMHRKIVPLDKIPVQSSSAPDPDLAIALEALPEKLRLPLVLCYSEGMTYEEAADVLRIPMTTLRGRIRRGKKELRKELDAE